MQAHAVQESVSSPVYIHVGIYYLEH